MSVNSLRNERIADEAYAEGRKDEREALLPVIEALKALAAEFRRIYPIYYYAEPWAHNRNVPLLNADAALSRVGEQ